MVGPVYTAGGVPVHFLVFEVCFAHKPIGTLGSPSSKVEVFLFMCVCVSLREPQLQSRGICVCVCGSPVYTPVFEEDWGAPAPK